MAEAFLRKFKGNHFRAAVLRNRAELQEEVHPRPSAWMREIGIDISHQRPKEIGTFLGNKPVQHVLIVCDRANQSCPRVWLGMASRTFMPFDDPAAADGSEADRLLAFRRVRDEISAALEKWNPESPQGRA